VDITESGTGKPGQEYLKETKIMCVKDEKDLYLYYFLLQHPGRTMVFCNSMDCLRRLTSVLRVLELNPLSLHGEMEQKKRLQALERFVADPRGLLLASDVAARGLDISGVEHVIHYQVPRTAEIYVHRSGRTARANNKGLALLLAEPSEAFNYKKLVSSLNGGNDYMAFPVDPNVLKVVRQRVKLAQTVDKTEHRLQKGRLKTGWFKRAAQEADILVDDREDLFEEDRLEEEAVEARKLKGLKKQLSSMLKMPLISRSAFTSHVTQTGTLSLPLIGEKKALQVIEGKRAVGGCFDPEKTFLMNKKRRDQKMKDKKKERRQRKDKKRS
jgi:ATP-dependent RNA helicase DDX24/MAK5